MEQISQFATKVIIRIVVMVTAGVAAYYINQEINKMVDANMPGTTKEEIRKRDLTKVVYNQIINAVIGVAGTMSAGQLEKVAVDAFAKAVVNEEV